MVGDNPDDIDVHAAATLAVQQVGEAMIKLRHKDQRLRRAVLLANRDL